MAISDRKPDKPRFFMPEETYKEFCEKLHIDENEYPYSRELNGIIADRPAPYSVYDVEVFVPMGKRYSLVRITWGSNTVRYWWTQDIRGKLPDSMKIQPEDWYYDWREASQIQD